VIIIEGADRRSDPGSPISKLYNPLFDFTGEDLKATGDVSSINSRIPKEEMKVREGGSGVAVAMRQKP
jgi:hypothetical protein